MGLGYGTVSFTSIFLVYWTDSGAGRDGKARISGAGYSRTVSFDFSPFPWLFGFSWSIIFSEKGFESFTYFGRGGPPFLC